MSTGFLEGLRKKWRVHANPMAGESVLTSQNFIDRFGKTATFRHVGIDRHPHSPVTRPLYLGQTYAVFSAHGEGGPVIPMTPFDVEHLAITLQGLKPGHLNREAIVAHLTPQIAEAVANLKAHQSTFARLNPQAAHFLAKFNGG